MLCSTNIMLCSNSVVVFIVVFTLCCVRTLFCSTSRLCCVRCSVRVQVGPFAVLFEISVVVDVLFA